MKLGASLYKHSPHFLRVLLLNGYALSLNLERYGKKFDRLMSEFEANQKLSRGELEEYQRERLKAVIHQAYHHVPYYRDLMTGLKLVPGDFKELRDIAKLPLLTRELLRKNHDRLRADNVPRYRVRVGHTSGTTGSPLGFLWDVEVCVAHHAADWRQKQWAGFRFGERFVSLQGRQVVPRETTAPPFWVFNRIHNQLFMSSFHLKDEYLGAYVEKIRSFQPKGVEGYPSSIYVLARYLAKMNLYLPVPAVLTSSETLQPLQRELIEERFQCKVFDFYGMAERVVYGSECTSHRKHLNLDYGLAEIVDDEGNPLPEGSYGTLVSTGLWNFAMPLIRYRTSDSSSLRYDDCPCGCRFPLMDEVTTKQEDIIRLPDGRLVPSSILTHPFKPLENIAKSQIIQEALDQVTVLLVAAGEFSAADEKRLVAELKERLDEKVEITVKLVPDIPKSASGKYRWVISKVGNL